MSQNIYFKNAKHMSRANNYLSQRLNKIGIFLYVENFLVGFRWYFIVQCGMSKSTKIVHLREKCK